MVLYIGGNDVDPPVRRDSRGKLVSIFHYVYSTFVQEAGADDTI
jgi:hypothetical protein